MGRSAIAAGLAVLALWTAPAAQERLEERVEVDFVLVDVVALDKKNRLVTDLGREDFVVTEDKRRIDVRTFDTLDLRAAAPPATAGGSGDGGSGGPAGAAPTDVASGGPLLALLAIDLEFGSLAEKRRAFQQMETFLETVGDRRDVAYLLYSLDDGTLTDDFDTDPRRVAAALREYRERYFGRSSVRRSGGRDVPRGPGDLLDLEERFHDCFFHFMDDKYGRGTDPFAYRECITRELLAFVDEQEIRARRVITELGSLARRFSGQDRLNTIFFVSPGFSLHPGRAAIELAELYLDPRRAAASEPDPVAGFRSFDPGLPGAPSVEEEFRRVVHLALANRVVFHSFDLLNFNMEMVRRTSGRLPHAGGSAPAIHRRHASELNHGLSELAAQSGGFFHSGPDLDRMATLLDRAGFVYTLGYPSPDGEAGFRNIKVKCRRKGVRLWHRAGYFAD